MSPGHQFPGFRDGLGLAAAIDRAALTSLRA